MIEKKYLDEFAYLGDAVYLDWGCMGMTPERTRKFCREFQDHFCRRFARIAHTDYDGMRMETRRRIAELIGAEPEEIFFTPNTSTGSSLLAASIEAEPGDNVIMTDVDYPGLAFSWNNKEGIEIRRAASENGTVSEEQIIGLMDEHTRAVVISYVQYSTGYKADLVKLGKACRSRGILFGVDGIQGTGRNPINVKEAEIDIFSCGFYKGLMGVIGCAFVYCRKELFPMLKPYGYGYNCAVEGESYTELLPEGPLPLYEDYRRMEHGTLNTYGICAAGESIALLNEIGIETIQKHVRQLEAKLRRRLSRIENLVLLGSSDPQHWSGNLCMTFPAEFTEKLEKAMKERNLYATAAPGFCRIGMHYCTREADIEVFAEILENVLTEDKLV